jgi:hypothetical protein
MEKPEAVVSKGYEGFQPIGWTGYRWEGRNDRSRGWGGSSLIPRHQQGFAANGRGKGKGKAAGGRQHGRQNSADRPDPALARHVPPAAPGGGFLGGEAGGDAGGGGSESSDDEGGDQPSIRIKADQSSTRTPRGGGELRANSF